MEIHQNHLKLKINEYVSEFYKKPVELKNIDHPFLEAFIGMLSNEIRTSMVVEEVKDFNGKNIKGNNENGFGCLKQPIKISSILGEGAFGKVYKVNSRKAVKIVSLGHLIWDNEINKLKENIISEFAVSKLAGEIGVGPKVYEHYTCCDDQKKCYYVLYMDLLKGKSLSDWLEGKPNQEEQNKVKNLLLKKLDILHQNSIIHNDLHRGNIFITKKGNKVEDVFIIDYGLATNFKRKMKQSINWEERAIDYLFLNEKTRNNDIYNYVVVRMIDNNDIKIKY